MTNYPDTDCEIHCDVRTEEPVCLICLIEDRDRLREQLEEAKQPQGGEIHCDVRTEEPVCLICLIEERDLLRQKLEEAERDRDSFADGLLLADFYSECPACGEYIDSGPHSPDCKYTEVIARARTIVDRQQPQGGEDE